MPSRVTLRKGEKGEIKRMDDASKLSENFGLKNLVKKEMELRVYLLQISR